MHISLREGEDNPCLPEQIVYAKSDGAFNHQPLHQADYADPEEVIAEPTGARGDGHICYKSRYLGENIPMSVCSGIMPYRSLVPAYQLGKGCRSGVLPLHRKDPLRGQGGHPDQHR